MLRKVITLPLLAGLALPALANDAKVLPEGVLRTTIAPSFTTVEKVYDSNGDLQNPTLGTITVNTVSLALEYGINDWITAGVQWAPGYVWSGEVENNDNVNLSGANDLFVGAKLQLLGSAGLVQSDSMRFAITPGVKIPTSQYDAQAEADSAMSGGEFKPGRTDRGAWGLGARFAFDLMITPDFYINMFNQTTVFLETEQDFGVVFTPAPTPVKDATVKYGTEMIFEVEPNYSTVVGNGIRLGFGLPVRYTSKGETELNGNGRNDEAYTLAVEPSLSVFFTQWALPMEFQFGYSTTLAGENSNAANTASLQIKNFVRF